MWPWKTSASGDSWVSVGFAPERLDVARVRRRPGQRPEVLGFESFACESNYANALRRLRGRQGVGHAPCTTLLRRGQYQLLQVDAPDIPPEERSAALRWRIKEMVDFPVEQAGVDLLDIPVAGAGRTPQVFVVAASHGVLNNQCQSGLPLYQKPGPRLGVSSATLGIDFHIFTATLDLAISGTGE